MFGLFNAKKTQENLKKPSTYSITQLTPQQRADIVAMRDEGVMPSMISEQTGVSIDVITNVILQEKRKLANRGVGNNANDELTAVKLEIDKLKLEKAKLDIEWAIEDKKSQRAREIAGDVFPDDESDDGYNDGFSIEKTLQQLILMKLMGGNVNPGTMGAMQPGFPNSFPVNAPIQQPQPLEATKEEIENIIEQYPEQAAQLQKLPDALIKQTLKNKFPQLSDNSVTLAIECLKKKEMLVQEVRGKKHG